MSVERLTNLALEMARICGRRGWWNTAAYIVGEEIHTHGDVHRGAARCAARLMARGVRVGEAVLIALPDGIEFVWAFLGAVHAGAVAVPVNPSLPPSDHALLAQDADPALVVCTVDLASRFTLRPVLTAEELRIQLCDHASAEPVRAGPLAPAYAQYTSGTTGQPRGVVHRHRDPLVYQRALGAQVLRLTPGETVLSVSKMYFAYGLGNSLFYPLLSGALTVLLAEHPRADVVAEQVRRHHVDVLFAVPSFYARFLECGDERALRRLRLAVTAGEPLPRRIEERFQPLGPPLLNSLGTTEVGQGFTSTTEDARPAGSVGRPLLPYRVRVLDESGTPLPPGRVGRLQVSGPTLPWGYLGDPSRRSEESAGWLCTGDLAMSDQDGSLYLRGRADDIEIVGGINVHPREIEEILLDDPRVREAAVVAVAEQTAPSALCAFVVPTAGTCCNADLARHLLAEVRARCAAFKVPRRVAFVSSLPRTDTGKLRRFVLREGCRGGLEPGCQGVYHDR